MRNKINDRYRITVFRSGNIPMILLCIGLAIFGCTSTSKKNDKVVAKVGEKYLYFSELKSIFPKGCTKEDSLSLSKLYIDNWIKTRLLLRKAELNLTDEQLNISEEIETYRTSLLIYKYEDRLLQNKLDTTVTDTEIQNFYEANLDNFLLDEYAVKALFLKIPANAPNLYDAKRWYVSDREKDIQDLTNYCQKYADKYDFFDDEWVLWSKIEKELPKPESAAKQVALYNRIEQDDNAYVYLVRLKEKRTPSEAAPLSIVKDRVKNIIMNKRKLKFIGELEKNIYNDALIKKQFEIYH